MPLSISTPLLCTPILLSSPELALATDFLWFLWGLNKRFSIHPVLENYFQGLNEIIENKSFSLKICSYVKAKRALDCHAQCIALQLHAFCMLSRQSFCNIHDVDAATYLKQMAWHCQYGLLWTSCNVYCCVKFFCACSITQFVILCNMQTPLWFATHC